MKNLIELERELEAQFCWGSSCEASNDVQDSTADKIASAVSDGFQIHIGNNPNMDSAAKWSGCQVKRLSLVNSRYHGKTIRTIWATK